MLVLTYIWKGYMKLPYGSDLRRLASFKAWTELVIEATQGSLINDIKTKEYFACTPKQHQNLTSGQKIHKTVLRGKARKVVGMLRSPKEENISKKLVQKVQYHWKCPPNSTSLPWITFQEQLEWSDFLKRHSLHLLILRLMGYRRRNSLYLRDLQEGCSHSRISLLLGQQKKHSMKK